MRLLFIILVLILAPLHTGHASDNTLPAKMQGEWSLPDCKHPEEFLITTPRLVLTITGNKVGMAQVKNVIASSDGNFTVINTNRNRFAARATNDGIFEVAFADTGRTLVPASMWDAQPIGQRFEYMHCKEIHHPLNTIGIEAVRRLESVMGACRGNSDCGQKIFAAADENDNKALTGKELVTAMKRLIFLHNVLERSLSADGLRQALETADSQARVLSEIILSSRDLNRSQSLTYGEIADIFTNPPQHSTAQNFNQAAAYLKPVAME